MSLLEQIKKAVEVCRPDFRHYYRIVKKARIVNSYASNGKYYCDVQPLRNDENIDTNEPVIPRVALPVFWGGNNRGIVCPPCIGVLCDLSYYDGDPNYPFISNIRWDSKNTAPQAGLNEFVIQLENGVQIKIDDAKNILNITPANYKIEVGKDVEITAKGSANINVDGSAEITAKNNITLTAPQIFQNGNVSSGGTGGAKGSISENADRTQTGSFTLNGNITVNGSLTANSAHISGNAYAASRSGGSI
ncbi:MAG TPA: baseplate assembly protein [Desulfovibrio sp.]|nr:baseplate assembly protein [Desulfovibrio sp.]